MTAEKSTSRARIPRIVPLALEATAAATVATAMWLATALTASRAAALCAGLFTAACAIGVAWVVRKIIRWDLKVWLGPFLLEHRQRIDPHKPLDVCFFFVDHFEPDFGQADEQRQLARVQAWQGRYERAVQGRRDSDGRPPRHTWFFPVAQSAPGVPPILSSWPGRGWGEIEYHIHHPPEMDETQIADYIRRDIARLQALGAAPGGRYGFVHGMFALAGGDLAWCRALGEIDVLRRTGCYADFTFGSFGTVAQPRKTNAIYYARTTGQARPYDDGPDAAVGEAGDGLLMIPGPMHFGLYGHVADDAHMAPVDLPHPRRIARWLDAHVHVRGRPNWVFIAVHSHTAREDAQEVLLEGPMQRLWQALEERFSPARGARLHYVTAREAYNIVQAARAGRDGNPGDYRDFEIPPPPNAQPS